MVGLGAVCALVRDEPPDEHPRLASLRHRLFNWLSAGFEGLVEHAAGAERLPNTPSFLLPEMMQIVDHLSVDRLPYRLVHGPRSDKAENERSSLVVGGLDTEDVRRSEMEFEGLELARFGIDTIELFHGEAQLGANSLESLFRGVAPAPDDKTLRIDHKRSPRLAQLVRPGE